MTEEYLTLQQVCDELQMTEEQVRALVSSGQLESLEIGGEMKFLRTAVVGYKQRVESKETVVFGEEQAKQPAKEDETDFEEGPPTDAVPAEEESKAAPEEETDFEEPTGTDALSLEAEETDIADESREGTGGLDLGAIEEESGVDESDQTSVLQPVGQEGVQPEAEQEPVFEFEEDDSTSLFAEGPVKVSEAPAVADEAEEGETISLSPEDLELEEVELSESDEPSHTEMVADILREETGTGEEDDSLETVDLAELEGGTEDVSGEASVLAEGSSAETQLIDAGAGEGGEDETIGLEATKADTEDVGGTLLEVSEGRLEEEEEELQPISMGAAPAMAPAAAAGEYVMVKKSLLANVLLVLSILFVSFGGFIAICGYMGYENPVTDFVVNQIRNLI